MSFQIARKDLTIKINNLDENKRVDSELECFINFILDELDLEYGMAEVMNPDGSYNTTDVRTSLSFDFINNDGDVTINVENNEQLKKVRENFGRGMLDEVEMDKYTWLIVTVKSEFGDYEEGYINFISFVFNLETEYISSILINTNYKESYCDNLGKNLIPIIGLNILLLASDGEYVLKFTPLNNPANEIFITIPFLPVDVVAKRASFNGVGVETIMMSILYLETSAILAKTNLDYDTGVFQLTQACSQNAEQRVELFKQDLAKEQLPGEVFDKRLKHFLKTYQSITTDAFSKLSRRT